MGNVVQSDVKGIQLFLNELDKGEAKLRQATLDAQNVQREQDQLKLKGLENGIDIKRDAFGQLKFSKIAAKDNPLLQAQLGQKAATDPNFSLINGQIVLDPNGPKGKELFMKEEAHQSGLAIDELNRQKGQLELDFIRETNPIKKAAAKSKLELLNKQIEVEGLNIQGIKSDLKVKEGTEGARINSLKADSKIKMAQAGLAEGQLDLFDETFDLKVFGETAEAAKSVIALNMAQLQEDQQRLRLQRDTVASKFDKTFIEQKIAANEIGLEVNQLRAEQLALSNELTTETNPDKVKALKLQNTAAEKRIKQIELDFILSGEDGKRRKEMHEIIKAKGIIDIAQAQAAVRSADTLAETKKAMLMLDMAIKREQLKNLAIKGETDAKVEIRQGIKNEISALEVFLDQSNTKEFETLGPRVKKRLLGLAVELKELRGSHVAKSKDIETIDSGDVNTSNDAEPGALRAKILDTLIAKKATKEQAKKSLDKLVKAGAITQEDADNLLGEIK